MRVELNGEEGVGWKGEGGGGGKCAKVDFVPLCKLQHHAVDLLRLARNAETAQKQPQRVEKSHIATADHALEVNEVDVGMHDGDAKVVLLAQIVSNLWGLLYWVHIMRVIVLDTQIGATTKF